MSAAVDERVLEEIGALTSILMTDVVIKENDTETEIEAVVHPCTAEDVDRQFVCLTLYVKLPPGYPDTSPQVSLKNPRGLDDELLNILKTEINQKLYDFMGDPVVFEIIWLIQDYLTLKNLPSEPCVICLYNFVDGDVFIKTQCYHYFHNNCFGKHLIAGYNNYLEELEKLPSWKKIKEPPFQQTCPVCRSKVSFDAESLKSAPPPIKSLNDPPFTLTPELKALQEEMAALKIYQVQKGGAVSTEDSGPPPLTITSPSDQQNEAASRSSGARAQTSGAQASGAQASGSQKEAGPSVAKVEPKAETTDRASSTANTAATPGSPNAKPAYTGPYRGFNRRGKPGRRGRGSGGTR